MGQRVDTLALKLELADALGAERAAKYWDALCRAMRGPSPTFAAEFGMGMSRHETALHNRLVLALLANACDQSVQPPPPGVRHTEFKPTGKYPLNKTAAARQKHPHLLTRRRESASASVPASGKSLPSAATSDTYNHLKKPASAVRMIQTLDDNTRSAILAPKTEGVAFAGKLPSASKSSIPSRFMNMWNGPDVANLPANLTPELQAKLQTLQTCRQSSSLPSIDSLKARMQVIGALNGVDIDSDCISFMDQALSTYLKDVISSVQERMHVSGETSATDGSSSTAANGIPQMDMTIQVSDVILGSSLMPILVHRGGGAVDAMERMLVE
ncbi:hypothetical protein HDU83_005490 [Entophlyctis luteolus]|nr:hypothetical protein HDU83_005490 [Entophlyctis luteolus]KAJ3391497.1 hypothetical protein HDU84_005872 [Entophlyctis sp. JEL0112]